MSELATIKIHLKGSYSDLDKYYGEKYLRESILPLSKSLFRQDAEVQIQYRDGSLVILIALAGSIYVGIGQYGSFRSGLEAMKKDAIFLGKALESIILKNGFPKEKIDSIRGNNHLVSKTLLLLKRIEKFKNHNFTDEYSKREAELISTKLDSLLSEASDTADQMVILKASEEARDLKKNKLLDLVSPNDLEQNDKKFYVVEDEKSSFTDITESSTSKNSTPTHALQLESELHDWATSFLDSDKNSKTSLDNINFHIPRLP